MRQSVTYPKVKDCPARCLRRGIGVQSPFGLRPRDQISE
jgi:hypothetical protein